MRKGAIPRTSTINMATFYQAFEEFLSAGKDVLYLGFCGQMSSTLSNAVLAAEELRHKYPDNRVTVVDSCAVTWVQAVVVAGACEKWESGMPMDKLAGWIRAIRNRIDAWFTVDNLAQLHRGGRLPATAGACLLYTSRCV